MNNILLKLFIVFTLIFLNGCGFHLRGKGATQLPVELQTMSLRFTDGNLVNEPILVKLRDALKHQAKIKLVPLSQGEYPQLILSQESTASSTLRVSTNARVSENIIEYKLVFRVVHKGKELLSAQRIHIQRDYSFDPLNVLGKEQEERYLVERLRQQAVQRILYRLTRIKISKE